VPWFRLDDSFHSHPKVIAAGNEAVGLFVRCGTYAAQHLTDGFVPEHVALLYGSAALADSLVKAKLWRRTRGGWQIHDYLKYNPTREAVENERKAAADRQRRRRDGLVSRRDSHRDSGRDTAVSSGPPTRPDPYSSTGSSQRGRHARPREDKPTYQNGNSNPGDGAAGRHPSARPLAAALEAAGLEPGHKPAHDEVAAAMAADIRRAITQEST
jgi:hypothetical protein